MKSHAIHFPCPNCRARIKAPLQLNGQRRNCPGCSHTFVVPRLIPEDAEPVLVLVEANDRLAIGVSYRSRANPVWAKSRYLPRQSA